MVFIKHNSLKSGIFFNPIFIPGFSGSRFFRVQVFQGPGFSGSGSRVRVQVLEVAIFQNILHEIFSEKAAAFYGNRTIHFAKYDVPVETSYPQYLHAKIVALA